MADPSTIWTGNVRGHRVEVIAPVEDTSATGADPTLLRPQQPEVRIDGHESDLERLEPLLQGDDADVLSLRQALDRLHAR